MGTQVSARRVVPGLSQSPSHVGLVATPRTAPGCNPTPGCPALHCLPEFAQTHVHFVGDAI